jgi:ABC-type Co2+ transport system permease subunit
MKYLLGLAAAGLFAVSTIAVASAECSSGHKSVSTSKPVTTAEAPVITPKPGR